MDVSLWSGVQIAVQSALSTAQAISGITKASTGVATYAGADPANGSYLYLSDILGMYQLDDRIIRAANTSTGSDTTELEGENTSGYDTFVTGNLQVVTFGASLQIVTDLQASGGDFNKIDVTTVHDLVRKEIPGAANPISYTGSCIWDPADAGFAALKAAADNKEKRGIKVTFANGRIAVFTGYIGFTGLPTGAAQDKVVTPFSIDMFGRPTYYTS